MPIACRLERAMQERGIGTMELAGRVGITPANLSRIKKGRVSSMRFATLDALCETLDCQPGTSWSTCSNRVGSELEGSHGAVSEAAYPHRAGGMRLFGA